MSLASRGRSYKDSLKLAVLGLCPPLSPAAVIAGTVWVEVPSVGKRWVRLEESEVGSSSSSPLEREHARPLVGHTAGWCRQRGREVRGIRRTGAQTAASRLVQIALPGLPALSHPTAFIALMWRAPGLA